MGTQLPFPPVIQAIPTKGDSRSYTSSHIKFPSLPCTQDSPCVTPRDGSLSVDDNLFVGFTYVAPSLLANLKLADLPKNPESRS